MHVSTRLDADLKHKTTFLQLWDCDSGKHVIVVVVVVTGSVKLFPALKDLKVLTWLKWVLWSDGNQAKWIVTIKSHCASFCTDQKVSCIQKQSVDLLWFPFFQKWVDERRLSWTSGVLENTLTSLLYIYQALWCLNLGQLRTLFKPFFFLSQLTKEAKQK